MLCIGTGSNMDDENRMRFENDEFYMKTEEEMREVMRDFPEACDNTVELAENATLSWSATPFCRASPLPDGETEESWFRKRVQQGLVKRYGSIPCPTRCRSVPTTRWASSFSRDFLPTSSLCRNISNGREARESAYARPWFCRRRHRGICHGHHRPRSVSNGLLFERFLSPERVEMPDIDVDFEDERRQEVIEHIKDVYGEDHVSGVITFGKLQAKNAIRDAARVLGHPYGVGDRLCKMVGDELGITLDKALATNPDFKKAYDGEPESREVIDAARSIEGNVRGEGVHACATIICRDPMSITCP